MIGWQAVRRLRIPATAATKQSYWRPPDRDRTGRRIPPASTRRDSSLNADPAVLEATRSGPIAVFPYAGTPSSRATSALPTPPHLHPAAGGRVGANGRVQPKGIVHR